MEGYKMAYEAHKGIIYLFLLLFLVKAVLFFGSNKELFATVRAKTKVVEMILGTLVLGSGFYLVFLRGTWETWLIAKIFLVLSAIPLAIIGFKKSNKVLVALSALIFIGLFIFMMMHLHI